jgi:hypothetical protein
MWQKQQKHLKDYLQHGRTQLPLTTRDEKDMRTAVENPPKLSAVAKAGYPNG